MTVKSQIDQYISSQPEAKRADIQALHQLALRVAPKGKLWFFDGTNEEGKVVANPSIGYGCYTINYADGSSREFYKIGISANSTGISVYLLGIKDKTFLNTNYAHTIGKAAVTGYCIKFKTLKNIHLDVLEEAMRRSLEMEG
jgi:hypothetical protein